jgi:hypothetical protein
MKNRLYPVKLTLTALAVSALFFVSGCKQDTTADTETTSATDNNICENEFMRVMPTVNSIAIDESGVFRHAFGSQVTSTCPIVTVDDTTMWPRTMTIDYGTGCTDAVDGKVRSGQIEVTIDRPWDSIGCVMTIRLDTFYVGAILYEGMLSVTRTSANSFHQVVSAGHCSKAGATPWDIFYASDRNITFTSGANNSSQTAIITIDGSNNGTDRNGKTWTATTTIPVVRDMSCTWITQGKIELTPEGKSMRTVDFGDGTCDNKGTVTIEGNTFEFTMN